MLYFYWHSLIATLIFINPGKCLDWNVHKPKSCLNDDNFTFTDNFMAKPIRVYVSLAIKEIYDFKEESMEFAMQIYFLEFWLDPTMKLEDANITTVHRVPSHVRNCIWTPDTIFTNSKSAILYDATAENQHYKVIFGGYLYRLSRYKITLGCQMDFRFYPLDVQSCFMEMSFLSSKTTEAILSWVGEKGTPGPLSRMPAVTIRNDVHPLQFSLNYPPKMDSFNMTLLTGNSSVILCFLEFKRHLTAGLINTYIPSFLVVCLSFVSFWLDVNAVPGRVTLGVTALLTLTTQIAHARSSLPPINYMTAMDVWLFGCLVMVFLSLIEFTLAHSWSRKMTFVDSKPRIEQNQTIPVKKDTTLFGRRNSPLKCENITETIKIWKTKMHCKDNQLDQISRYLFPISAITFIIAYLIYYGTSQDLKNQIELFSLQPFYWDRTKKH